MSSEKKVLVMLGHRSRPVTLSSSGPEESDLKRLENAVYTAFSDVLKNCSSSDILLFQIKDQDWDGMFVDLEPERCIPHKSLIKVTVEEPMVLSPVKATVTSIPDHTTPNINASRQTCSSSQMRLEFNTELCLRKALPEEVLTDLPVEESQIIEAARIFKKESLRPLSEYQKCINKEAGLLALQSPTLLTTRGVLLEQARARVVDGGFQFKKGKSRSKNISSDQETSTPRKYTSKAIRERRIGELNEEIAQLDQQVSFKLKRVEQAELKKNYKLCDEISEEIGSMKNRRRVLYREKKSINRKTQQSDWYQKRKRKLSSPSSYTSGSESDSTDIVSPPSAKQLPLAFPRHTSPPFSPPVTPTSSSSSSLSRSTSPTPSSVRSCIEQRNTSVPGRDQDVG